MSSKIILLPLALCLTIQPFLTLAQQVPAAQANVNGNDLVKRVCEQSDDKNLCYATIGSKPDIQKANLNGIAIIALRVASDNAKDAWKSMQKKMKEPMIDPAVQQCLWDCAEQYINAVEQLEDSIAATLSNSYTDVHTWVEAAMAAAQQCQQRAGSEAVITAFNTEFLKFCRNVLIVDKLLDEKH